MQPNYESAQHEPATTQTEENAPSLLSAIQSMAEEIQAVKDDVSEIKIGVNEMKGGVGFLVERKMPDKSSNRPTTIKKYQLAV